MAIGMRRTLAQIAGGRPSVLRPGRATNLGGTGRASLWPSGDTEGDAQAKEANPQPKGLFLDANAMKDDLRKQMAKPEYDVAMFYYKRGIWQFIARHPRFEKLTLTVIALNAVWIAVDTDFNTSSVLLQAGPVFQLAEHFFCIYFSFEWTMRFMAFRNKMDGRKDFWFVFDSLLVLMMVLETWAMTAIMVIMDFPGGGGLGNASILRMARLLRLTRMARMARLLRAMPELLILIKGMAAAMRSVMFTLGLLAVIIYVFAIAFTQLCAETHCEREFSNVGKSMHYLLVKGALMDGIGDVQKLLEPQSYILLFIFYVFVLLAALTVMNMLIGVICEVVSAVATTEQERMTVSYVKDKIAELIHAQNKDDDEKISRVEFKDMFSNTQAMAILQDVGVDVMKLVDFADTIFDDACEASGEEKLSFEDFMGLILDLRGSNNATVKDVVDLRKHINSRIENFENKLLELPHFAMARQNSKYRHLGTQGSCGSLQSGQSMGKTVSGSGQAQDAVKVLRQLVDQSLQDFTTLHNRELNELREKTRRLQEALVSHGGNVMAATGSLYRRDDTLKYEDISKTTKLKDVLMDERLAELAAKQPLEEAIAEMTYHKGCHVLETSSPRLGKLHNEMHDGANGDLCGKLHNETHDGANGKIHESHMAETDGTHFIVKECRVTAEAVSTNTSVVEAKASSASTCATSPNPHRQDCSPKRGHLLATHIL